MKRRLSITVDDRIIKKIDSVIDGRVIRSRSHAIEYFLTRALGEGKLRKAFILAGGKGTKLKPITYEIPKPMMPVKGRPILEYTIDLLREQEVRDIIISVGYLGDKIKNYFGNGEKFGVKIIYVEEETQLGTAGPLKLAKPLLDETFLMINGDNLFKMNVNEMFRFHKENKALATIALTTMEDVTGFGVVRLEGNKIVEFVEKPPRYRVTSHLINAGVYIIEPEVINLVPSGYSLIEKDVFPKIAKEGRLFGYVFSGRWYSTDTLERYEKALKEW
ncbi:MAG: sugar phosphate nucleotidyltransferase [Candidatus Parvarchaeota archaeon]|nr:sugar phosphate nucleotidyltransferase [Candidatus Jingweiarchaeum tengchongense]MCW1298348.1 sugar phosphate nucleotidyltransferase [Candidatus Jingweiarchaeum tengchongense]MCW1300350.1 sugar phosphate nucleotidyltransferase [Candidatus Jingweiarchaeum tengchongense]MCW1309632.1 sugar phosphate nucleotidyltransferase [Candidatus Jingweiarchaeum tengchongense]MCW1310759.1 sugar phosphate nucleotidyltransferase [Candidatus Jingweiarchaeum tengchongense]